jgi:hypothetical protein
MKSSLVFLLPPVKRDEAVEEREQQVQSRDDWQPTGRHHTENSGINRSKGNKGDGDDFGDTGEP